MEKNNENNEQPVNEQEAVSEEKREMEKAAGNTENIAGTVEVSGGPVNTSGEAESSGEEAQPEGGSDKSSDGAPPADSQGASSGSSGEKKKGYGVPQIAAILLIITVFSLLLNSNSLYIWATRMEVGPVRTMWLNLIEPLHDFCKSTGLTVPFNSMKTGFRLAAGIESEAGWEETDIMEGDLAMIEFPETTPEATTDVPPSPTPVYKYASVRPMQVLLLGDSMVAESLSTMFGRTVESEAAIEYEKKARYSSGLSRPDYYNWPAQVRAIQKKSNYDLTIVMLGMNDAQDINVDKAVYHFGTEGWFKIYKHRFRSFLRLVLAKSKKVYWLGPPLMRLTRYNKRMRQLHDLYEEVCGEVEGAHFISTEVVLKDDSGKYSDYLKVDNKLLKVRTTDGIHFTLAGAGLVVEEIMKQLNGHFQFANIEEERLIKLEMDRIEQEKEAERKRLEELERLYRQDFTPPSSPEPGRLVSGAIEESAAGEEISPKENSPEL